MSTTHTHLFCRLQKGASGLGMLLLMLLPGLAFAQTTHLSPTVNNGGFESDTAGWIFVNGSQTNKWVVSTGADAGFSGAKSAYVSQSTTAPYAHTYNIGVTSVVQFYRDITFPAGETNITLSFKMKVNGESSFDYLRVFIAPTTVTPAAGTQTSTTYKVGNDYTQLGGWSTYTLTIPQSLVSNASAASTRRLIFEWRNDNSVGTMPPAGIDDVTLISACGGPAASSATSVATTSATLNWSALTGATSYNVRYKKLSDPVTVATWATPTVVTAPTTSLAVTGLPCATTYQYEVSANGTGVCTAWGTGAQFTTLCCAIVPPWIETFEGITANNQLPACMAATNFPTYTQTYTAPTGSFNQTNHTSGGTKYGSFRWGCNDWFFSPELTLTQGQNYIMKFWYITDGYANSWQQLKAAFGTSATAAAMTTNIGTPLSMPTNTTYQQYTGVFTAPSTGSFRVGIYCQDNGVPWYLSIDDISVELLPPCSGMPTAGTPVPSGIQSGCPGTTYNLSANNTTQAGNLTYQWLQSTNANPAWVPAVGGAGATTPNYTTPALSDTIRYRLKVTCTNSNLSDTTAAVTFNVPKPPYATVPFLESFESWISRCGTSDIPSQYWTNTPFTGERSWRRYDQGATASWACPTCGAFTPQAAVGTYSARYHGYAGTAVPSNLSFNVNCSGGNPGNKELRFYHRNYNSVYAGDSIKVAYSLDGGANFTQLAAYGYSSGAWQAESLTLPSTSATTVVRFSASIQSTYWGDLGLDHVQVLGPCAGKPTAGTIVPVTPCPNAQFTLTTNGTTIAAGLNYQWQKSANGVDWVDVTPNGTNATLDQSINAPTWYRMLLKCVNGNQADTTAPYLVQLQNFYVCYCTSNANIAASFEDIGNVTIKTQPANVVLLNNGVGTPVANNSTAVNAYTNFTSLTPTMLIRDSTYNFSVQQISAGANATSRVAIYLDTNRDGTFQTTELILSAATNAAGNWNVNGNFTVPTNARIGITGMRVILWRGTTVPPPCGVYNSYGETEDYLVNISYRPCTGPSNAGTVFASTTSTCVGYPISLGDTTYEKLYSRLSRTWQVSTDGGTTWLQIPNSLNKDTLQDVVVTGPSKYRVRMVCHATNDTTFSTALSVGINPPYACYCYSMANGGFLKLQDTSDVGMFRIGNYVFNTGGPHLQNPESWRRRTDYTAPPDVDLYADSTYGVDVYHILRRANHADAKITLFMDFNNNLQYDAPQERVWTGYSTASNWYVTTNVAIPHNIVPETPTGMRLIINNNTGPNVPSDEACGTYVSGETEDYVVMFHYANKLGLQNGNVNLKSLAVFPNPTEGRFTVSYGALNSVKHADLTVTNMTGQQMISRSFDNTGTSFSTDLDLTQFAKGVYFVELRADGEKLLRKLVVR